MSLRVVTVLGANGTMGNNVANMFFTKGISKVHLVTRSTEKSLKASEHIQRINKLEKLPDNIFLHDYESVADCIHESDLVFESVSENLQVKMDVLHRISQYLSSKTLVCSGSSGLSLTALSQSLHREHRSNFCGVHFFNPPHVLTLCELIPTEYTSSETIIELKRFLEVQLGRTVVEVRDTPAFLGNRIGFQFLNRAMQFAEKHASDGGIDYIDAILGNHTGRQMAPLVTVDFVGLDVHKAIVDNLFNNTLDGFHKDYLLPAFAEDLIKGGSFGRKSKCGLYKQILDDEGRKHTLVYDMQTKEYRNLRTYNFPFVQHMRTAIESGDLSKALAGLIADKSYEARICLEFLLLHILCSLRAALDLSNDIHAADHAMTTGYNWCAPMALANEFTKVTDLETLLKAHLEPGLLQETNYEMLLDKVLESKYLAIKSFV